MTSRTPLCARILLLSTAALALQVAACNFGSEAAFTNNASLHPCDSDIPVCNTTAGCILINDNNYVEGAFPGTKQLIVPTEREGIIQVLIYWRTQEFPGADTEVIWHEPACIASYSYQSQGVDIFADSNSDGLYIKEMHVTRAGDHLIEVRSDAVAEFLLRTRYLTVQEWEDEQAAGLLGGFDIEDDG